MIEFNLENPIIGGHEGTTGKMCAHQHHGSPQGAKPKAEVIAKILADIRERRA